MLTTSLARHAEEALPELANISVTTDARIAHRTVCPYLQPEDRWPWTTALRQENERRAQRLFNLPEDWGLPGAG
ncbi:DUF6083 domain-containing protein [Streptomyces sp. NBC_01591]|uniref:DUF6083 domain-containing protein n=1 Tax=Streptomyces sp. NBC_01591 TaxID=2975888 RepID=UPI002DD86BC8|nr:DUF6083 domain-containing protein [Streptomyces sp. NBC_01591]WSD66315.1 DUF6083 domain-containing protein [Streptomyces sp. NBC_01591]